ncbi:MAG: hypothetical protein AB1705_19475 [Verrucomicrobiota bacterium]
MFDYSLVIVGIIVFLYGRILSEARERKAVKLIACAFFVPASFDVVTGVPRFVAWFLVGSLVASAWFFRLRAQKEFISGH